jgi:SAM-dependent methyltransferase
VNYDPTTYRGAATYYRRGRAPYSEQLAATLTRELGLDGRGRLLDVGCGPGVVAIELAGEFRYVIGLDPDPDMLLEAADQAARRKVSNIGWIRALAEHLPARPTSAFSVVTFAQSFHRTDRERVAEAVYDLLEPGGSIVLMAPTVHGRPAPEPQPYPPMPHEAVERLVARYLGTRRRSGQGFTRAPVDRFEDALARTRFGTARTVFAPGRPDIIRDIDSLAAHYHSMSWAAPHLFGDDLQRFDTELRALLLEQSPNGLFWDWPGDTELVIAQRPRAAAR